VLRAEQILREKAVRDDHELELEELLGPRREGDGDYPASSGS
jgi:hypothetical protein